MALVQIKRTADRITFRSTTPPVSGILRLRTWLVGIALAAATFLVFCISLGVGDSPLSPTDVLRGLFGQDAASALVVRELRMPRAVVALLVGAALGMSGAILQTITRNPLAGPDMIGITHGAGTAVVTGIVLGVESQIGTQVLGLSGGLAAALLIYLLSWKRGTTGYRIVLMGIGISWTCIAITDYLLTKAYAYQAHRALGWLVGNLNGRDFSQGLPLLVAMSVLVPTVLLLSRWMRVLQLGDETATGLGIRVQLAQLALLVTAVGLAAFATAAAGPVLFAALAAPQIAQRLCHQAAPPPIVSALTGSLIVTAADLTARQLLGDAELPVGVVTGAFGAAVLLWLLARTNRSRMTR
ncbi:FecCD family ABC transporter permease [Saccharopolyspora sp. 5N708]|uniref:FecCD family ABC transporter permease n=1 Tax=Saccharopolyspora sp. 5N708 TaxID=3457424 RepID=UPI003FD63E9C